MKKWIIVCLVAGTLTVGAACSRKPADHTWSCDQMPIGDVCVSDAPRSLDVITGDTNWQCQRRLANAREWVCSYRAPVCHSSTEDSAITDCEYRGGAWYRK